jgi:biopolymer transport protein ExbB/TolQ
MMDGASIAGLGSTAGAVTVVILFLKFLSTQKIEDRTANKERDKALATQLNKLGKIIKNNTKATKSNDEYLRQRNGRDIEKHAELIKATKAIPEVMQGLINSKVEVILDAIVNKQEVKEQHVGKQIVEK